MGVKEGDLVTKPCRRNGEYGEQFLKEEAASIVRNNVPNYDYVSEFVRGLRTWPIGNFMAFPSEIMRTSTNIVKRSLDEISYTVNGKKTISRDWYATTFRNGSDNSRRSLWWMKKLQSIVKK